MNGKERFISELKDKVLPLIKKEDRIVVVHHNDADGIASGAILKIALERFGSKVTTLAIERVHPLIVERIVDKFDSKIIFADLGSRAAPQISEINKKRRTIIIIDHHIPSKIEDEKVFNFSTEFFDISGDKDISGAGACYLFANLLGDNSDLAYIGVIGAIGDSHERFGKLLSVNREIMEVARSLNDIDYETVDGKEVYYLTKFGGKVPLKKFAKELTVLGAVGFYLDGVKVGIEAIENGPSSKMDEKLKELNEIKNQAFNKVLEKLEQGKLLKKTKYIQWFDVEDQFKPMGVKVIGEFCMEIRNREFLDKDKYITGFQHMDNYIPGLGEFNWKITKASMRVSDKLEEKIINKGMPGLSWLVPEAAKLVNGSIDACHDYAAATTVNIGDEEELIRAMDQKVEEFLKNS